MNQAGHGPSSGHVERSPPLIVLGAVIAIAAPVVAIAVAALWDTGLVDPDRNDPLVRTLSSLLFPSLILSPIGLLLAGSGWRVHGVWRWAALFAVGLPLAVIVWFVAAAWLGGLAGQPL
jgi:hypothetical protein